MNDKFELIICSVRRPDDVRRYYNNKNYFPTGYFKALGSAFEVRKWFNDKNLRKRK